METGGPAHDGALLRGSSMEIVAAELPPIVPPSPFVYEKWAELGGRNRFSCNGRLITGPSTDAPYCCCAWFFLVVPCVFYVAVCAPWLIINLSPLIPLISLVLFVLSLTFLILTSCTDPGIIPRRALQAAVHGLEQEVALACGKPPDVPVPTIDGWIADPDVPVPAVSTEQDRQGYRWCQTCKIMRPPRSSHCRDCDNCVLRFDHHCPFVNNCIGQRNYRYFTMFIVSTCFLAVSIFTGIGVTTAATVHQTNFVKWLMLILVGVPTVVMVLGVIALSAFHAVLAVYGRTTREVLTGRGTSTPPSSGSALLAARGPSLIHARDRIIYQMAEV